MATMLKKKKTKSNSPNASNVKSIRGRATSKKLSLLNKANKNEFILNASLIQDRLDEALAEAIKLYKSSANRLGVKVDIRECKSNPGDSKNWMILKKVYESPEKRQLLGAYLSARDALHTLNCRIEKAKILGGDMTQADVFQLLDSFRSLGVASYCIFDGYLQEDFSEAKSEGIRKARNERHVPTIKMRNEANRLYDPVIHGSKNQAKYALKGLLVDFANREDVGFKFKGNNIEQTIYEWLLYPNGRKKRGS